MATTVYVDLNIGTATGTGTTGDPYGTLTYALAQEDTTADDVTYAIRHTGVTKSIDEGGTITIATTSNTSVTIEPDTGYGWSGGVPQITFDCATGFNVTFNINQANVTIRDFVIIQSNTGSGERAAVQFGSGADSTDIVEGCVLYSDRSGILCSNGNNEYATVRNCLIANYSDDETSFTAIGVDSFANVRAYNNVMACGGGNGITFGASGDKTNTEVKNNVFLDCGTNQELDTAVTQSNNATDKSSTPTNLTGAVLNVVAGDFESASLANPRTGNSDFRLASGNTNLKDAGTTIASFSTDAEGTSRPQGSSWDIGYHELASAGGSVAPLAGRHLQNMMGN